MPVRHEPLGFVSAAAKDGRPYTNIPTTHLTTTNQPPPHPLASFQNGLGCTLLQHPTSAALLASSTPCQREFVCGTCIGNAQVGASLVATLRLGFIFKRSSLRSFCDIVIILWYIHLYWLYPSGRCSTSQVRPVTLCVCTCMRLFCCDSLFLSLIYVSGVSVALFPYIFDVMFVTHEKMMPVSGTHIYRVYTPTRYATIPKLTCWHVVSVLRNIWWSPPRYATIER